MLAVGNLKGGVGKSTLAVNVAAALAAGGPVVLLDADAQGTAAHWIGQGRVAVRCVPMVLEDVRAAERWIGQAVAEGQGATWVVIDLPPHVGAVAEAAMVLADLVVVPVPPSGADLLATGRTLELVREARGVRGDGAPRCLLVPSRVDRRTAAGREAEAALEAFGEPVGPAIGQRSAFVDAFSAGEWVGSYAPGSKAAEEIGALVARIKKAVR